MAGEDRRKTLSTGGRRAPRLIWLAPTLLLAVAAAPAPMPTDGEVYGAIWADVRLNAQIGTGNPLISVPWASGCQPGHTPELKVLHLDCRRYLVGVKCGFDLSRTLEGETCSAKDGPMPPLLSCKATLTPVQVADGSHYWGVKHRPPLPGGTHTRTTMQCKVPGAD